MPANVRLKVWTWLSPMITLYYAKNMLDSDLGQEGEPACR